MYNLQYDENKLRELGLSLKRAEGIVSFLIQHFSNMDGFNPEVKYDFHYIIKSLMGIRITDFYIQFVKFFSKQHYDLIESELIFDVLKIPMIQFIGAPIVIPITNKFKLSRITKTISNKYTDYRFCITDSDYEKVIISKPTYNGVREYGVLDIGKLKLDNLPEASEIKSIIYRNTNCKILDITLTNGRHVIINEDKFPRYFEFIKVNQFDKHDRINALGNCKFSHIYP